MSYQVTVQVGTTSNQQISKYQPAVVACVRVGGTAPLVGTISVRNGSATIDTIPAASAVGLTREYYGAVFSDGLAIQCSDAGDRAIIIWGPA